MTTDIALSSLPTLSPGWLDVRAAAGHGTLLLRRATRADADLLRRMFVRCTPATRYARFHAALQAIPASYLQKALSGDADVHDALVAELVRPQSRSSELVAIGSVAALPSPAGADPAGELALLVEDAWQGQGVGTWLIDALGGRARRRGIHRVLGHVLAEGGSSLPRLLRRLGPVVVRYDGATLTAEATLSAPVASNDEGNDEGTERLP